MSTTTPSSTYSSIIPSYSFSNLTELYYTYTVPSYVDMDCTDIVDHMMHGLYSKLSPFIDIRRDYDVSNSTYTYHARLKVAPLAVTSMVRNDLYILDTLLFTESDINAALRQAYPERFI